MRKLTVRPRLGSGDIKLLERSVGYSFPEDFKNFMIENSGLNHYENLFKSETGTVWEVQRYNLPGDLHRLTEEFKENGLGLKIPFAYDPGGWHYCLSFDPDTFGKIIVNRWTDHDKDEQFLIIAESFESFINALYAGNHE